MWRLKRRGFVSALLVLLYMRGACGCYRTEAYRNFWLELYSTTPCGDSGQPALGVCAVSPSCTAMGGQVMGVYNCPTGVCCRPRATCDATSVAVNLLWESEEYLTSSLYSPSSCTLNVVPSSDTCFIRIDFTDMDLQSTEVDGCENSYLQINNQFHGDGHRICGTLNHRTTFAKVGHSMVGLPVPVEVRLRMGHIPHKYSATFTHVKCSSIKSFRTNRWPRDYTPGEVPGYWLKDPTTTADGDDLRENRQLSYPNRKKHNSGQRKVIDYLGRMFAVSYTKEPLIRSCPVTFIADDIVIGSASCTLRLGGPGTSKGLMVVHGYPHDEAEEPNPRTVGDLARYIASHGVVVKNTIFHPMYNHDSHEHDIALYYLNKTVSTAVPIKLPVPIDDFIDLTVFMTRYHYYDVSDDVTILVNPEELITKVVPNSDCSQSSLPGVASVTSNDTLCIAPTEREHPPCPGEIGTPIVHIGGSGTITLLGLMMGGYHHCAGKHSYAEPAIKIINYLDFIDVATSPVETVASYNTADTSSSPWYLRLWG